MILAPNSISQANHRCYINIRDVIDRSIKISTMITAEVNMDARLKVDIGAYEELITHASSYIITLST